MQMSNTFAQTTNADNKSHLLNEYDSFLNEHHDNEVIEYLKNHQSTKE